MAVYTKYNFAKIAKLCACAIIWDSPHEVRLQRGPTGTIGIKINTFPIQGSVETATVVTSLKEECSIQDSRLLYRGFRIIHIQDENITNCTGEAVLEKLKLCKASTVKFLVQRPKFCNKAAVYAARSSDTYSQSSASSSQNQEFGGLPTCGGNTSKQENLKHPGTLSPCVNKNTDKSNKRSSGAGIQNGDHAISLPESPYAREFIFEYKKPENIRKTATQWPECMRWSDQPKTVVLHKSDPTANLGFKYVMRQDMSSQRNCQETYFIVNEVTHLPAMGKIFAGDWIRSANGTPLTDNSLESTLKNIIKSSEEFVKLIIQTPETIRNDCWDKVRRRIEEKSSGKTISVPVNSDRKALFNEPQTKDSLLNQGNSSLYCDTSFCTTDEIQTCFIPSSVDSSFLDLKKSTSQRYEVTFSNVKSKHNKKDKKTGKRSGSENGSTKKDCTMYDMKLMEQSLLQSSGVLEPLLNPSSLSLVNNYLEESSDDASKGTLSVSESAVLVRVEKTFQAISKNLVTASPNLSLYILADKDKSVPEVIQYYSELLGFPESGQPGGVWHFAIQNSGNFSPIESPFSDYDTVLLNLARHLAESLMSQKDVLDDLTHWQQILLRSSQLCVGIPLRLIGHFVNETFDITNFLSLKVKLFDRKHTSYFEMVSSLRANGVIVIVLEADKLAADFVNESRILSQQAGMINSLAPEKTPVVVTLFQNSLPTETCYKLNDPLDALLNRLFQERLVRNRNTSSGFHLLTGYLLDQVQIHRDHKELKTTITHLLGRQPHITQFPLATLALLNRLPTWQTHSQPCDITHLLKQAEELLHPGSMQLAEAAVKTLHDVGVIVHPGYLPFSQNHSSTGYQRVLLDPDILTYFVQWICDAVSQPYLTSQTQHVFTKSQLLTDMLSGNSDCIHILDFLEALGLLVPLSTSKEGNEKFFVTLPYLVSECPSCQSRKLPRLSDNEHPDLLFIDFQGKLPLLQASRILVRLAEEALEYNIHSPTCADYVYSDAESAVQVDVELALIKIYINFRSKAKIVCLDFLERVKSCLNFLPAGSYCVGPPCPVTNCCERISGRTVHVLDLASPHPLICSGKQVKQHHSVSFWLAA